METAAWHGWCYFYWIYYDHSCITGDNNGQRFDSQHSPCFMFKSSFFSSENTFLYFEYASWSCWQESTKVEQGLREWPKYSIRYTVGLHIYLHTLTVPHFCQCYYRPFLTLQSFKKDTEQVLTQNAFCSCMNCWWARHRSFSWGAHAPNMHSWHTSLCGSTDVSTHNPQYKVFPLETVRQYVNPSCAPYVGHKHEGLAHSVDCLV